MDLPKQFYDVVRSKLGGLSQSQVDGFSVIGEELARHKLSLQHQSYLLATPWWETAHTMQPIEEYGQGKGHPYGMPAGPWNNVYDGNGDVQLTWYKNYLFADTRLHALGFMKQDESLVRDPALARRPDLAAKILVYGCEEGWFGKPLSACSTYEEMRAAVNGTDHAAEIAAIARIFEEALIAGPLSSPSAPAENPAPAGSGQPTGVHSMFANLIFGIIRSQLPAIVAALVAKGILPPGDTGTLVTWFTSLLTSIWSVQSNLPPTTQKFADFSTSDKANVLFGILRAHLPAIVPVLTSLNIIPTGDIGMFASLILGWFTSLWSIHTNLPTAVVKPAAPPLASMPAGVSTMS